jgi:nicotinate-nucleotide adenylyltransferase
MKQRGEHTMSDDRPTGNRVAVFGGTFDPFHVGHLMIALEVRHALGLDRTVLVVANDPWQKAGTGVTPARHRLELARAGVDEINARMGASVIEVSDVEIRRGGETYTADTLEEMKARQPDLDLYLLVGSDTAAGLPTWKRPDVVRSLATTVVVERGGRVGGRPPEGWPHLVIDVPLMEVSSSDLRQRFLEGRPVEAFVPPAVIDCIRRLGLYGPTS